MNEVEFERDRLAFFERCGAAMKPVRFADREGRTIYALERGSGPPVILVHGGGGDAGQWAPLLPLLPAAHRYIVVDRPGHGLSYRHDYRGRAYRAEAVAFMEDLVNALGTPQASLIGNSMGGFFSLAFALAHPERVHRLVLVGAPAGVDRWIPPVLRLMGLRGFNRLLFRLMRNPTPAVLREKLWKPVLVARPDNVTDELIELGIVASSLPGAELAWRTLLERFIGLRGVRPEVYLRDEVATLATPTTFVWGDKDAFAPPTSGQKLVDTMPHGRLVTIGDAGHLPWFDDAPGCAAAIADALDASSAAPEVIHESPRRSVGGDEPRS